MTITNGFAQLNDGNDCSKCSGADWTQIIINPDLDFSDMKFALSLTGATDTTNAIDVYYLLAGGATTDADNPANYTLLGQICPVPGITSTSNSAVRISTASCSKLQAISRTLPLGL